MLELTQVLNFATIILIIILPAIGTAIGQALASKSALRGMYVQPAAYNEIFRISILGMALMETAEIVGIALSVLLIIDPSIPASILSTGIARLGIAVALGISGFVIGIVSAWPTIQACRAVARQPFFAGKILNLLLITQTLVQTPILFCFMIAWFIKTQAANAVTMLDGVRLLSSGIAIGIGAIGPIIGLAWFAQTAIEGLGTNRKSYAKMFNFAFISQAIIETPILLAFVIAFIIVFSSTSPADSPARWAMLLAAALATGLGTLIPSIQSGKIASVAGKQIAQNPDQYSAVANASMVAQALIDTFVIYAAVISILMLVLL
jgi:F0F1-type ATP synthase membrane subunit c/vacuolar-type H+-ATPase subunit K